VIPLLAVAWTADRVAAIAGGLLLLAGIGVFFFGRRKPAVAAESRAGRQTVTVVVQGGYKPDLIVARRGVPLRLVFDRRETSPCSDEIVLPEFGVRRALPAHATTELEIVPERTGEFEFTCGMNMLHGKILVE
jgi:P-type Cu+ transporter